MQKAIDYLEYQLQANIEALANYKRSIAEQNDEFWGWDISESELKEQAQVIASYERTIRDCEQALSLLTNKD